MQQALLEAKKAFELDEVPVGAVLVENGQIIASNHNKNRILTDPTAHAEILVLRQAALLKNSHRLDNCDLYVTLEPCAMCAAAISLAHINNVYYGCNDDKFGAVENGVRFYQSASCLHQPQIYSGIAENQSRELMQNFFRKKR